jgi:hypothetical protein
MLLSGWAWGSRTMPGLENFLAPEPNDGLRATRFFALAFTAMYFAQALRTSGWRSMVFLAFAVAYLENSISDARSKSLSLALHWLTYAGAALGRIFYVAHYQGNDAPMAPLLLMVFLRWYRWPMHRWTGCRWA